jgi:tRNA(fMet)-specific endonuclease VapC
MQFLVDSDWVIDYMHGNQQVVQRFDELSSQGVGLRIISFAELYDGVVGAKDPPRAEEELQKFLGSIEVLPLNEPVCRVFASERARLRTTGTLIKDFDLLIGSTAIYHDLTLLTNNRAHFERMRGLSIIPA